MRLFLIALLLLPLFYLKPVLAQENEQQQLDNIEQQIEDSREKAAQLKKKAERVASLGQEIALRLVTMAAQIRTLEATISQNEEKMFTMTGEIAAKKEAVRKQNLNMAHTLAALQRLSQRPPEYIIMRPAEAVETVRGASLLTAALPEIKKKTNLMRTDLEELNALKQTLASEQHIHKENLESLQRQNADLKKLQREKQVLYKDYLRGAGQEEGRIKALAREARDLKSLIEKLENEMASAESGVLPTPPIPPGTSFAKAKGRLPFPARGTISQQFGGKTAVGTARGIDIQTRPGTQVIAPFDGRIIFAGEFRTYGNLLIIAHGEGYHSLLAGLGTIETSVGQWVLAGEPVGSMPEVRLASTDGGPANATIRLYLEIRKGGEPVNPLPWLAK